MTTWSGDTAGKAIKAHEGGIHAIHATKDLLYSGGEDGIVISWSLSGSTLKKEKEIINLKSISKFAPGIRGIDLSPNG